jgi:histone H1/5
LKALQKMASSTNSRAQRIVTRRAEANMKAWKLLVAEARKSVSGAASAVAQPVAVKKAAPKRKAAAAKKKVAPKKKAASKKKAAPKKKAAAKKKAAPKRKTARR